MPDAPLAPVPSEILDQFGRHGPISVEELDAAGRRFKKAIIARALGGELTHHLGYPPGGEKPDDTANHRKGTGGKTVLTDDGPLPIDVPRDRDGPFEPRLIAKPARRFTGFDDKSLARYARGMTVREIQGFLAEMYGTEVSPDLISTVPDGLVAEVTAWQSRPLERLYPVVFFDALRVKIRDEATVRSKAISLALAVLPDGTRDILGLGIEQTDGATVWMKVFSARKTRGCQDILIAVTDGLKGMSEALAAVFPEPTLQTCIVHLIRHSLDFATWKERKPMATALRPIYTAASAEAARAARDDFERGPWGRQFPTVVASWRRAWTSIIPFFALPPDVRRLIYTTNALESVHAQLRPIIKTRGPFPTDAAATTLIWLALRNLTATWARTSPYWRPAMNQFAILYEGRFRPINAYHAPARGRCRSRGRRERAHRSLDNRPERGFPQRPHASSFWAGGRSETTTSTRFTHEIPDSPCSPCPPRPPW